MFMSYIYVYIKAFYRFIGTIFRVLFKSRTFGQSLQLKERWQFSKAMNFALGCVATTLLLSSITNRVVAPDLKLDELVLQLVQWGILLLYIFGYYIMIRLVKSGVTFSDTTIVFAYLFGAFIFVGEFFTNLASIYILWNGPSAEWYSTALTNLINTRPLDPRLPCALTDVSSIDVECRAYLLSTHLDRPLLVAMVAVPHVGIGILEAIAGFRLSKAVFGIKYWKLWLASLIFVPFKILLFLIINLQWLDKLK